MLKDFKLPDLGEGVHEGCIIRVMVKPGEHVREDQPLMEVETDKAAVEVPSPFEGVVSKVHIQDKQFVHVGDVMFTFEVGARAASAPPPSEGAPGSREGGEALSHGPRGPAASAAGHSSQVGASTLSPAPSLRGRGSQSAPAPSLPGGRITPASPAVRKRARALGLDLSTINGGGPAGRVRMQDLEAAPVDLPLPSREGVGGRVNPAIHVATPAARIAPPRETASGPAPTTTPTTSPFAQASAAEVREELSQARKTIALNMVQSWTTIPHVTDCEDADVTELDRLRQGHNITLREGETKLSLLPFVIRAVAMALTRHPIFNATFDDKSAQIIYKRSINLAIGMHTERGLIAPVLREADTMNVAQIAAWLAEWTVRGREAKFAVNDLRGGTYTISNAGAMGGSRYSTPIITPGQAAVLALGRTRWEPRVIDQQVVPRYIMPLSHSFDHRIIDGGQEIAFQRDVIGALENPARLLL